MSRVHHPTNIPSVVLAGGSSRRFGSAKGLAELGGKRLIDHVLKRLRPQTSGPLAINGAADGPYAELGLPMIEDGLPGKHGPLAGLHAALLWASAQGASAVLTAPIDTPFLPPNLLEKLAERGPPSVAASNDRVHGTCGLWPVEHLKDLEQQLQSKDRSLRSWVKQCNARIVDFPAEPIDPFFNINTPDDMAEGSHYYLQIGRT